MLRTFFFFLLALLIFSFSPVLGEERPLIVKYQTALVNRKISFGIIGRNVKVIVRLADEDWKPVETLKEATISRTDFNDLFSFLPEIRENRLLVEIMGASHVNFSLGTPEKLREVVQFGTQKWRSFQSTFAKCRYMNFASACDSPDLSYVTNMSSMFDGCSNFNSDLSGWDVSHVTNMLYLFRGCSAFDQDLGAWELKNCKYLSLAECAMSTENYSKTLQGWAQKTDLSQGFRLYALGKHFDRDTKEAREKLIRDHRWTILGDVREGATAYPLCVGDIYVTSDNVNRFSEELQQAGILKKGHLTFDVEKKILSLENIELDAAITSKFPELKIKLVGNCSVKNVFVDFSIYDPEFEQYIPRGHLILMGDANTDYLQTQSIQCHKLSVVNCALKVNTKEKLPVEPLIWILDNANVNIKCVGQVVKNVHVDMKNCAVAYPRNAYWHKIDGEYTWDGNEHLQLYELLDGFHNSVKDELKIVPVHIPPAALYIAGEEISPANIFNLATIAGVTLKDDGHITYAPASKILSLKNVAIEMPDDRKKKKHNAIENRGIDGLTILIEGENKLSASDSVLVCKKNTTLRGNASLEVLSNQGSAIMLENSTLTMEGLTANVFGMTGISGDLKDVEHKETLVLDQTTLSAAGTYATIADLDELTLKECDIIAPMGGYFDAAQYTLMNACKTQRLKEVSIEPRTAPLPILLFCQSACELTCYEDSALIPLRSNTSWNVKSSVPWLKCSPESGTGDLKIKVTAEANPTNTRRFATIILTSVQDPTLVQTFLVTQNEKIYVAAKSIKLNKEALFLDVGMTYTLVATVYPSDATSPVEWKSDAPIVMVENGKVAARAGGFTTIEAQIDGLKAKCDVVVRDPNTEIQSSELATVSIFPNPFTDVLSLSYKETQSLSYKLLSPLGRSVQSGTLFCGETMLDTKPLAQGLYYLIVSDELGRSRLFCVVKE